VVFSYKRKSKLNFDIANTYSRKVKIVSMQLLKLSQAEPGKHYQY